MYDLSEMALGFFENLTNFFFFSLKKMEKIYKHDNL